MQKHLRRVRWQLYKNLLKSYQGWYQWHRVIKKYGLGNTAVVLLPNCDQDNNYTALLYLDQMLTARQFDNALILTHCEIVTKTAPLFSNRILDIEWFDRKQAEQLMQYYCLYEFDKRLIVASLDEPNGRNGRALIGKKGTTLEEVFVIGVYGVYPYMRLQTMGFNGNDPEVKDFLTPRDGLAYEN